MTSFKQRWSRRLRKRALDLGLYGHTNYSSFIVLGRSRVGSNLLRGLLDGHPRISTFGEIFRDVNSMDWDHTGYFQSRRMCRRLQAEPVRFLDERVFGRYPKFVGAVGFKIFYYHAREGVQAPVWSYLKARRDLKVIHLKRRNVLQTHLSRKRAAMTDRWVNTSGQPDGPLVVSLDYEECLKDFVQTRAWEEEHDRFFADHPIVEVQYEHLVGDGRAEARRIQEFLGVEPHQVAPSTYRQARQPLSTMIANYSELKERFSGTVWSELFSE